MDAAATRLAPALAALLLASTVAACGAASAPPADLVAGGACLGRLCLGMTETEALAAAGDRATALPSGAAAPRCYRTPAGVCYSFWVDQEDPARRVVGILATAVEHCSGAMPIADPGALATCRGVRLGDPESFVTKMHRQATTPAPPSYPWPDAPDGTRQIDDVCEGADESAPRTSLYLRDGRVFGLAIREVND